MTFEQESQMTEAEVDLRKLERSFDAMVAKMQTLRSQVAIEVAFKSSPDEMGQAAMAAATVRR